MTSYLTVVYKIEDKDSFNDHIEEAHTRFAVLNDTWSVTGMSRDDEMTRLNVIEDAVAIGDIDKAVRAIECNNIAEKWESV